MTASPHVSGQADAIARLVLTSADTRTTALRVITRAFAAAAIDTPGLDARRLLQATLGIEAADLVLRPEATVGPAAEALMVAARRRLAHEPISRILGCRDFYGLAFEVTPDTLDPRPDTETLVDLAIEIVDRQGWRERPLRILDYGTGSGCVLLALLLQLPQATGIGADISGPALQVARRNAASHGAADRIRWLQADGLAPLLEHAPFDLVVSNPPYIASDDIAALAREVRDYDPHLALDGGGDGLDHFRQLAAHAAALAPLGWVAVEIGAGQASAVSQLARAANRQEPCAGVLQRRDLAGHIRCVAWQPQN